MKQTRFEGFSPSLFRFFDELSVNNSKEWFDKHRELYEVEVLGSLKAFTADLGQFVHILNPERFAGSDIAASIRDLEEAIKTQDPQQRKQVAVSRFAECPGMTEEQPYPATCQGAAGYLRVKVSVPLESTFRYPPGTFPSQVAEAAVVRIN